MLDGVESEELVVEDEVVAIVLDSDDEVSPVVVD